MVERELIVAGIHTLDQCKSGALDVYEAMTSDQQLTLISALGDRTSLEMFKMAMTVDWLASVVRMFALVGLKQLVLDHADATGEFPSSNGAQNELA